MYKRNHPDLWVNANPALPDDSHEQILDEVLAGELHGLAEIESLKNLYAILFRLFTALVRAPEDRKHILHHSLAHPNSPRVLYERFEIIEDVGFLFAKIAGFSNLVSYLTNRKQANCFQLLDSFYDKVDALAASLGLVKVKYDGAVIMIATANDKSTNKEKAEKLYLMSIGLARLFYESDLADYSQSVPELGIQIGAHIADSVHKGPLGLDNPVMDYIGTGVNRTARQAACEKDTICISPDLFWHLPEKWAYFEPSQHAMKGLGKARNYSCSIKDPLLIPDSENLDELLEEASFRVKQMQEETIKSESYSTPKMLASAESDYQRIMNETRRYEKASHNRLSVPEPSLEESAMPPFNEKTEESASFYSDSPSIRARVSLFADKLAKAKEKAAEPLIKELKANIRALYRIVASQIPEADRRKALIKRTAALLAKQLVDLDNSSSVIAKEVGIVTADIKGFTALTQTIAESKEGGDKPSMMALINAVYKEVDLAAEDLGLQRVRFVGDCVIIATPVQSELSPEQKAEKMHALMVSIIKIMYESELYSKYGCGIRVGAHLCKQVHYGSLGLNDLSRHFVGADYEEACSYEPEAPVFGLNISQELYTAMPPQLQIYYTESQSMRSGKKHYVRKLDKQDSLLSSSSMVQLGIFRQQNLERVHQSRRDDSASLHAKSEGGLTDDLLEDAEEEFSVSSSMQGRRSARLSSMDNLSHYYQRGNPERAAVVSKQSFPGSPMNSPLPTSNRKSAEGPVNPSLGMGVRLPPLPPIAVPLDEETKASKHEPLPPIVRAVSTQTTPVQREWSVKEKPLLPALVPTKPAMPNPAASSQNTFRFHREPEARKPLMVEGFGLLLQRRR